MSATSEIHSAAEPPIDRLRLVLASVSAGSVFPFAVIGYRVLLILPIGLSVYLLITGIRGYDPAAQLCCWCSVRLVTAFFGMWGVTVFLLRFLHASSSGNPSDLFLFLVPGTLLFAAIIYRFPCLSKRRWKRHVVALGMSLFFSALLPFSFVLVLK